MGFVYVKSFRGGKTFLLEWGAAAQTRRAGSAPRLEGATGGLLRTTK